MRILEGGSAGPGHLLKCGKREPLPIGPDGWETNRLSPVVVDLHCPQLNGLFEEAVRFWSEWKQGFVSCFCVQEKEQHPVAVGAFAVKEVGAQGWNPEDFAVGFSEGLSRNLTQQGSRCFVLFWPKSNVDGWLCFCRDLQPKTPPAPKVLAGLVAEVVTLQPSSVGQYALYSPEVLAQVEDSSM